MQMDHAIWLLMSFVIDTYLIISYGSTAKLLLHAIQYKILQAVSNI